MEKGLIRTAIAVLMSFALIGCNNTSGGGTTPTTDYTVTISNKDALKAADFKVGDDDLSVSVTIPGVVTADAYYDGDLVITSSNTSIISIVGSNGLHAAAEGNATITATYKTKFTDTVSLHVGAAETCVSLYGTVHTGLEADPLDSADAVKVAKAVGTTATEKAWYISGEVDSFRNTYDSTYKNASVYIGTGTNKFLVYHLPMTSEDQVQVTDTITVKAQIINYYGNTPETNGTVTLVKVVEGPRPTYEDVEATVSEAIAACKELGANNSSKNYYVITGYVVKVETNYTYLSDTNEEITGTPDVESTFVLYKNTAEGVEVGAKVKVRTMIYYYSSSSTAGKYMYETTGTFTVEILEPAPTAELTGIELNKDSATLTVGSSLTLKVSPLPANAKVGEVTWTSSDEKVATVADGVVTPVAVGTTTITATCGEFSDTCEVTVKEGSEETEGLTIDSTNFTKTDESTTGYAAYAGDHEIGSYTVNAVDVMESSVYGVTPAVQTVQFKKTTGVLTIDDIKVTKITFTLVSTYDLTSYVTANFDGKDYSPTEEVISNAIKAKTDTGSAKGNYPLYQFVYEIEVNAASAGTLKLVNGFGYAVNLISIVIE